MAGRMIEEKELLQEKLAELANEISSDLAALEGTQGKELLSDFVSELFLLHGEKSRQAERKRKQAAGIAAAKARGVRFGRPGSALPPGFDGAHEAWREGRMALTQAASACGMSRSTFYHAALKKEQGASQAG